MAYVSKFAKQQEGEAYEHFLLRCFCYDPETGGLERLLRDGSWVVCNTHPTTKHGHLQFFPVINGKKVGVLVHRFAFLQMTGCWPVGVVDHLDGNPVNNTWLNLADVSAKQNAANRAMSMGRNIIYYNGKYYPLGSGYDTYEAALAASLF